MDTSAITAITSMIGSGLAIGAVIYSFGRLSYKIDSLEEAVKDLKDEIRNDVKPEVGRLRHRIDELYVRTFSNKAE
jgi:hypothetical protein